MGFDILDASRRQCVVPTRDDGGTGITMLGPRDAATLLVVSDAEAALNCMMRAKFPPPLIVCVGPTFNQRIATVLSDLAPGRSFELDNHPESEDIRNRLASLFPKDNGPERHSSGPEIDL